jgi:predicted PurR-regulated permease PerM
MIFERVKNFLGIPQKSPWNFREKFVGFYGLLSGLPGLDNAKQFRLAFQSLVYPLLIENNSFRRNAEDIYRHLLEEFFSLKIAENNLSELINITPLPYDEAAAVIKKYTPEKAVLTAEFITLLTVMLGGRAADIAYAGRAAESLGMKPENFSEFLRKMTENEKRRQRLRNSSRGLIAALVIILIFFLTAKFLQSVIFGLLLACILLPLEKFYEKRLLAGNRFFTFPVKIVSFFAFPLKKLSNLLLKKADEPFKKISAAQNSNDKKIIRQAVAMTTITALIIACAAMFGISKLTGHYMKNVQNSIYLWEKNSAANNNGTVSSTDKYNYALEQLKENFESIPLVQYGLDYIGKIINDPATREQLFKSMMRNSGGIINLTGGVLGGIVSFLADLLLTVFFALLFLSKFAEFSGSGNKKRSGSEYIVRSFFNGIWLPGADEHIIKDTCRIIDNILWRLRTWLKGYLTLILVDSTFYTISFFFLGVPFFLPLGLIAGCGIALPYLGPVISCTITLLATIAAGEATGAMLLAIVICYIFYMNI